MANETKLNIFAKKNTVINNNNSACPKFSLGAVIDGKYRVEDKLGGNSGEADLYKVVSIFESNTENSKQKNVSETMVLKLYRRKDSVKRNVLESLISIRSSNVAEIIDNGNIEGFTYIVIPFYENGSLASYIEGGNLFDIEAIKTVILPSIAEGLKAIHSKGIIHKDIKPSNLMVSNDQNNVVLIDFGISSATEGNTVVVTQTGKSPFYSAPETTTGLFLVESDYYSLGITLYELVTGYTPYQNANIENIARYAQIQKIPYPEGFDKELADLIDGLTYKDISNRNDKSNPNRRWGYEEIMRWIWGAKLQKPGSVVTENSSNFSSKGIENNIDSAQNQTTIPYMFDGRKLYSNRDIVLAFFNSWEDGKKELYRGYLSRHYELSDNKEALKICRSFKNESNDSNVNIDLLFLKLMYQLEPSVLEFFWKNYVFEDLTDYGNQLIDKTMSSKDNAIPELVKTAKEFIKQDVIIAYLETHSSSINENLQKIIHSLKNLIITQEYDLRFIALKLGHILTGREEFICAGIKYKNVNEFNAYIDNLYSTNYVSYINLCRDSSKEINNLRFLFANKLTNHLSRNKTKDTIEFDGYIFDNFACLLRYHSNLKNGKEWINKYKYQIIRFIKDLDNKAYQQLILSTLNIKLIEGNISIGNYVKFGYYWQSNSDTKEPIEWLVLDVEKGKRALLLSKYALDCKPYHEAYTVTTWEHCDLRKWLNTEFINNAFSEDEQNEIQLSTIINEDNPQYRTSGGNDAEVYQHNKRLISPLFSNLQFGTRGGNNTEDKIFLLSIEEAEKYFNSEKQRMCKPTKYAVNNGAENDNYNGVCWWWLRSPCCNQKNAVGVNFFGGVFYGVHDVHNYSRIAVRVALWVNL